MAIVKSDKHWKNALRNYTALDGNDDMNSSGVVEQFNGGIRSRIWCCKRKGNLTNERDGATNKSKIQFTTPMRRIINKMPG